MGRKLWAILKQKKWLFTALLLALVLVANTFVPASSVPNVLKPLLSIGFVGEVYAANPDFLVDGTADNVQVQEALDALPGSGGKIQLYGGNYAFIATVLRSIDNVIFEGVGASTSIANNGTTALFDSGDQANWVFRDMVLDAGGIDLTGNNFTKLYNVKIGSTTISYTPTLETGQTTVYAAGDDADNLAGTTKAYQVLSTGQYSSTTAVYLPTLARNDIAFVAAGPTITAAAGLDIVKNNDVIRIRGSTLNETEYTVAAAGGGSATTITLTTAPVEESSGSWITIAKRGIVKNSAVWDLNTGLMWMQYGSYYVASGNKLGAGSDGKLYWTYTAVTIHAAAADLQMIAGGKGSATVKIVGGAGEILKYWAGYSYSCTGFANAVNNLPGFRCVSVTINGADLDIVMATGNQTCIAEAAAGARTINLSCNGIFDFANACIAAGVGGYSDWRVANFNELLNILDHSLLPIRPDVTAFPTWIAVNTWVYTSTSNPKSPSDRAWTYFNHSADPIYRPVVSSVKTDACYVMLLRGGI